MDGEGEELVIAGRSVLQVFAFVLVAPAGLGFEYRAPLLVGFIWVFPSKPPWVSFNFVFVPWITIVPRVSLGPPLVSTRLEYPQWDSPVAGEELSCKPSRMAGRRVILWRQIRCDKHACDSL